MKTAVSVHLILLLFLQLICADSSIATFDQQQLRNSIEELSSFGSRSTGSPGFAQAAEYVEERLQSLGLETEDHYYEIPYRRFTSANLNIDGREIPLTPLTYNAITPQATDGTISGPLLYVGRGNIEELDGKVIQNSIVVMQFDSARNWQLLASLGARAVIFIHNDNAQSRMFFSEKQELTPLQLPCFWMPKSTAEDAFGNLEKNGGPLFESVILTSKNSWGKTLARNIYTVIEGTDPQLKNELLILESFFDNEEFVVGNSPGADAAASMATFLELAASLTTTPPRRSVLLLATSGHAQTLAGMREAIWSINARSKDIRKNKRDLQKIKAQAAANLEVLQQLDFPLQPDSARDTLLASAIKRSLDHTVDEVSRQLMQLRVLQQTPAVKERIQDEAKTRLLYRKLSWSEDFHNISEAETRALQGLLADAISRNKTTISDTKQQLKALQSAMNLRSRVRDYEVAAIISLHLSSHGNGVGGFHRGWLYNLKQTINRTSVYSPIADILEEAAGEPVGRAQYQDSLRPSHMRSWESWFFDQPLLGGEVSALAGYLGLSLVTTGDGRMNWGTPADTIETIDWTYLADQTQLVERLVQKLGNAEALHAGKFPRDGFVTVSGRTNLLLQGELFANYPAAGTTILAYQGLQKYYAMVDESGSFQIKGLADKKHVLDKLIIEGYRYDKETGKTIWAIDKKLTGKNNYRLKLLRKSMV